MNSSQTENCSILGLNFLISFVGLPLKQRGCFLSRILVIKIHEAAALCILWLLSSDLGVKGFSIHFWRYQSVYHIFYTLTTFRPMRTKTQHIFSLFLQASYPGNQSLPLTFLLCSELSDCITAEFTAQLFFLSLHLNPLYYSHVSDIQSPSPILQSLFCSVLFVSCHSFVLHSTPPTAAPPPVCVMQTVLQGTSPWWFI